MRESTAWISWNEGLALIGSSVSGFDSFLRRRNIPVLRVAGGRLLQREEFFRALEEEFVQAVQRFNESGSRAGIAPDSDDWRARQQAEKDAEMARIRRETREARRRDREAREAAARANQGPPAPTWGGLPRRRKPQ